MATILRRTTTSCGFRRKLILIVYSQFANSASSKPETFLFPGSPPRPRYRPATVGWTQNPHRRHALKNGSAVPQAPRKVRSLVMTCTDSSRPPASIARTKVSSIA